MRYFLIFMTVILIGCGQPASDQGKEKQTQRDAAIPPATPAKMMGSSFGLPNSYSGGLSMLARIIRNPTRKRGNPASFLAYASGYYCAVFWESWRQTHVHKRLAMS
ncbi:MAG: hypothetical protein ACI9HK_000491 [Pirellulaceae bacterium]|jgi:hypothetical protein